MEANLDKKTCKMCCMEIPQQARKCPHCHHFQNRWSMVMFHPAFMALFACIPLAAMLVVFATIFDTGDNFETYKDQIVITDSQIALGDTKSGATVAVIGTIKNTSRVSWKEIQFHVDFWTPQASEWMSESAKTTVFVCQQARRPLSRFRFVGNFQKQTT